MTSKLSMLTVVFLIVALSSLNTTPRARAQVIDAPLSVKEQSVEPQKRLRYLLYRPEDDSHATPDGKLPLLLFLHGGGEGGDDITRVKKHGPPKLIAGGRSFPFYVLAPQNPSETQFWDDQAVMRLLDQVVAEHPVDPSRIYLTGLSRGAYGAWRLAIQNPKRFAALIPISGGGALPYAGRIRDVPIWVFHGANDPVIPAEESRRLVKALKSAGSNVRYTEYPDTEHDAWTAAYTTEEVYTWMLQQRRIATKD